YFLAGATGLVLSFLAGVMVGRGVDQGAGEVQAARPPVEERVVSEETPRPAAPPAAEDLTYAHRLESDKADEGLDKSKGQPAAKGGPAAGSGNLTIQVGAFKDKAAADSVVSRLKTKGFAAYVLSPEGEGLFNVRVGNFAARADAERIQGRLRDEEKFKPFIV